MNASTVIAQPLVAQLETYRPTLPESVAERQRAACARFLSRGFPVRRDEEWKYTSVQGIANRAFTLPDVGEALPQTTPTELEWPHGETRQWRFVDGRLVAAPDEPPEGVTALPLAVALTDPFWQERFAAFATSEHSSFVDLNTALASGGLCLRITAPVATPLEIVWQVSAGVAGEGASIPLAVHPRLLVVVEAGASATLIEHAIGDAASSHFVNAVSEITLARNAQLTHYVVQELPAAVQQIATHAVAVDANACYRSFNIQLGGRLARHDFNVHLHAPEAVAELEGLYLVGARQHIDTHTRLFHEAAATTSRERYRLIGLERGRGVFKGKVRVAPGAAKSDAQQSVKSLLLHPGAEIDAKPELEIYTDDVTCSHGATVGQLDRDTRFYLLSRGLSPQEADALLIFAFAEAVVEAVTLPALKTYLTERLVGRLPDRDILEEQL